jgi:uncharacterized protein YneF (UPF0154 family)
MTLLIIAAVWLTASVVVGLIFGRWISAAEKRDHHRNDQP